MISKTATQPPGTRTGLNDFQGKAAIITGAASGIGLALAEALAARGADLALADIDAPGLDTVRERLASTGRRINTRVLDVSSDADVHAAASEFESKLGKVHLVVNNAGIDMSGALSSAFAGGLEARLRRQRVRRDQRHSPFCSAAVQARRAGPCRQYRLWCRLLGEQRLSDGSLCRDEVQRGSAIREPRTRVLWHWCRCVSPLPGSCENAHCRTLKHCKRKVQGRHRGRIGARGRGPSRPRGDSHGRVLHLHADAHAGRPGKAIRADSRGAGSRIAMTVPRSGKPTYTWRGGVVTEAGGT